MGAAIVQDGKPVAYYSRKLNAAQKNYTTMEKELLSVVCTLKEFRSVLLGTEIHVHTDHKNNMFENFTTQRVLRWRVLIEEFQPKFHYIQGNRNFIADWCSCVPLNYKILEREMEVGPMYQSGTIICRLYSERISLCVTGH